MKKRRYLNVFLTIGVIVAILLALLGLEHVPMTESRASIILIVVVFVWLSIAIYKEDREDRKKRGQHRR